MTTQAHDTAVRRGRPRKNEGEGRRQDILKCAVEAFTAGGFQGTSIEEVARLARVSKMTIYNHFDSKEGLFNAMAQQVCAPASQRLTRIPVNGRAALDVLSEMAHAMLAQPGDDMAFRLLRLSIFEQERFPDIARAVYSASVATLAPLTDCMRILMAEEKIAPGEPEETAIMFFGMIIRGHRFLLVDDRELQGNGFAERAVKLFLFGASSPGCARPQIS